MGQMDQMFKVGPVVRLKFKVEPVVKFKNRCEPEELDENED
jgi:hypothetical protein